MKKMLVTTAALALVGMVAQSADVTSSNIVGYSKIDIVEGLNMVGVNLQAIGGGAGVFESIVPPEGLTPGNAYNDSDNLLIWNGTAYDAYYYYNDGEFIGWFDALDNSPADILPGASFWIKALNAGTIKQAGEVNQAATTTLTLQGGKLNMVACPYAAAWNPNDLAVVDWDSVTGMTPGNAYNDSDNLYVWNGVGYDAYYYYNDGEFIGWFDALDNEPADIPLGQSVWIKLIGAAGDVDVTFNKPY